MTTEDVKKALNERLSTGGNPGKRFGYWLAGSAVVAAGAVWAFRYYRKKREQSALNPTTVGHVDVNRYMGRWFEIARIPYRFEKGTSNVQAFYTLEEDGSVKVENYALKNGRPDKATGSAHVVDPATNAKLKVSFFWPFQGDYWILGLGNNYEWALVGGPTGEYLWILSRTPTITNDVRDRILDLARTKGFDVSRLSFTPQEDTQIGQVLKEQRKDGHGEPAPGMPEPEPEVLYPDIE